MGASNYTIRKLITHALNMMTGFSTLPLQPASLIGFLFTLFGPDPYPVRTAVQYVLSRAQRGDTLVFGSLTVGEVEYYLRRFDAPNCLRRETFPLDTQSHPGWLDVQGLLSHREELTSEASTTTERLATQPGSTVWLFYSNGTRYGYEVTDVLKQELDQKLTFVEALDLRGTYFDAVLVYSTDLEQEDSPQTSFDR